MLWLSTSTTDDGDKRIKTQLNQPICDHTPQTRYALFVYRPVIRCTQEFNTHIINNEIPKKKSRAENPQTSKTSAYT